MKQQRKHYWLGMVALVLSACNVSVSHESTSTTVDSTVTREVPIEETIAEIKQGPIVVDIPQKGADWEDYPFEVDGKKLVISAPKGIVIDSDADAVYVRLDDVQSMVIDREPLDMAQEKQWYLESNSRKDLQWLIDTDKEVLYTGQDLGAPKGHQTTNSFFATKKVAGMDFSTNVDGITVGENDDTYNLSPENCQLLLGIFRTLRAR